MQSSKFEVQSEECEVQTDELTESANGDAEEAICTSTDNEEPTEAPEEDESTTEAPADDDNKDEEKPTEAPDNNKGDIPQTGDNGIVAAFAVCAVAAGAFIVLSKKKED